MVIRQLKMVHLFTLVEQKHQMKHFSLIEVLHVICLTSYVKGTTIMKRILWCVIIFYCFSQNKTVLNYYLIMVAEHIHKNLSNYE